MEPVQYFGSKGPNFSGKLDLNSEDDDHTVFCFGATAIRFSLPCCAATLLGTATHLLISSLQLSAFAKKE